MIGKGVIYQLVSFSRLLIERRMDKGMLNQI